MRTGWAAHSRLLMFTGPHGAAPTAGCSSCGSVGGASPSTGPREWLPCGLRPGGALTGAPLPLRGTTTRGGCAATRAATFQSDPAGRWCIVSSRTPGPPVLGCIAASCVCCFVTTSESRSCSLSSCSSNCRVLASAPVRSLPASLPVRPPPPFGDSVTSIGPNRRFAGQLASNTGSVYGDST